MSGVTSSPPGNDDIKSSRQLAGQRADDGANDVIDSYTVQDGELYEVRHYTGAVITGIGSSGTSFTFNLQIVSTGGTVRFDEEIANAYTSGSSGDAKQFAYPGDTVRIYEAYDADDGGELEGRVYLTKRL